MQADVLEIKAFLVIVSHYWGRGKTIREALREAKRAGGNNKEGVLIYAFFDDEKPEVSESGSIRWYGRKARIIKRDADERAVTL